MCCPSTVYTVGRRGGGHLTVRSPFDLSPNHFDFANCVTFCCTLSRCDVLCCCCCCFAAMWHDMAFFRLCFLVRSQSCGFGARMYTCTVHIYWLVIIESIFSLSVVIFGPIDTVPSMAVLLQWLGQASRKMGHRQRRPHLVLGPNFIITFMVAQCNSIVKINRK